MRESTSWGALGPSRARCCAPAPCGTAHAQMSPAQALLNNTFVGSLGGVRRRHRHHGQAERLVVDEPGHRLRPDVRQRPATPRGSAPMRCGGSRRRTISASSTSTTGRPARASSTATSSGATTRSRPAGSSSPRRSSGSTSWPTSTRSCASRTFELSGTFGVHYMDLKTRLSGNATITNGQGDRVGRRSVTKENSVPLPLPVIGIRAGWAVAPQWYLEGQGQFFKANIGDYDGRVTDLRASATWMFSPGFGVGLGYNQFIDQGGRRQGRRSTAQPESATPGSSCS